MAISNGEGACRSVGDRGSELLTSAWSTSLMGWNFFANWTTCLSLKILYVVFPLALSGATDSLFAVQANESRLPPEEVCKNKARLVARRSEY